VKAFSYSCCPQFWTTLLAAVVHSLGQVYWQQLPMALDSFTCSSCQKLWTALLAAVAHGFEQLYLQLSVDPGIGGNPPPIIGNLYKRTFNVNRPYIMFSFNKHIDL